MDKDGKLLSCLSIVFECFQKKSSNLLRTSTYMRTYAHSRIVSAVAYEHFFLPTPSILVCKT
jgi:hypothetical protein